MNTKNVERLASVPWGQEREDWFSFRMVELTFIGLNVCALVTLLLIQIGFRPYVYALESNLVPALLLLRAVEQCGEGLFLYLKKTPLSTGALRIYTHASIWLHLAFAVLVSLCAESDEAHYIILLLLPLIAACFRYNFAGIFIVAIVAGALNFFELHFFYILNPEGEPTHVAYEHYFELATMVLIYPVVGIVLWRIVSRLRLEARNLRSTIVELENTQSKLVEQETLAAVGRLASAIAHEIRNPVAMISSALEMAKRKEADLQIREEFCGIAAQEAARLEKFTTDFLSYARTQAPELKRITANEIIEYATDVARPSLGDSGPKLTLMNDCDCVVMGDAFQLHQAMLNLLLNAIEHTTPGRKINVGVCRANGNVELYVENEGAPVPQANRERIFEPFYTTRNAGTGLGLSISQKIARQHNGKLILSRNSAECVRFSILLPGTE